MDMHSKKIHKKKREKALKRRNLLGKPIHGKFLAMIIKNEINNSDEKN
jgi:hypothetical protein